MTDQKYTPTAKMNSRSRDNGFKRVVITGAGLASPIGNTVDEFTAALKSGRSGIDIIRKFDVSSFPARLGGEVKGLDIARIKNEKRLDDPMLSKTGDCKVFLGLWAFYDAVTAARLSESKLSSAGINLGVGLESFNLGQLFDLSPHTFQLGQYMECFRQVRENGLSYLQTPLSFLGEFLAKMHRIQGGVVTNVSACTASTQAIGHSFQLIRSGRRSVMITGGFDSMLNPLGLAGFTLLGALSPDNEAGAAALRPFDLKRKGTLLGEGSGMLVLEDREHALKRGAPVLAEIAGFATTLDSYKLSAPAPEGEGIRRCMEKALADAGVIPETIDYINAHGTGTPYNDVTETTAIKKVFGDHAYRIPVSSTKSMLGHLIGAAGALEVIACIRMINEGFVAPTINLEHPDPECDLDYVPNVSREYHPKYVVKNSMGFGGQNATLIIRSAARDDSSLRQ